MLRLVYKFYKETTDSEWCDTFDINDSDGNVSKLLQISVYGEGIDHAMIKVKAGPQGTELIKHYDDYLVAMQEVGDLLSWAECLKEDFLISGFTENLTE